MLMRRTKPACLQLWRVFVVRYSQSGKTANIFMFFGSKGSLMKITPMMSSGWSQPMLQILNTKLALRATCGKFKITLFSLDKKISNTQQVPAFVFHVNEYHWHLLPCQIALQWSQLFIGRGSNWLWGKHPRGHANFLMPWRGLKLRRLVKDFFSIRLSPGSA